MKAMTRDRRFTIAGLLRLLKLQSEVGQADDDQQ